MLQGMYLHFLMTFEDHKIVAVTFMVTKEKILAMSGINLLPIFQRQLYRRKRRMRMKFIAEAVLL